MGPGMGTGSGTGIGIGEAHLVPAECSLAGIMQQPIVGMAWHGHFLHRIWSNTTYAISGCLPLSTPLHTDACWAAGVGVVQPIVRSTWCQTTVPSSDQLVFVQTKASRFYWRGWKCSLILTRFILLLTREGGTRDRRTQLSPSII